MELQYLNKITLLMNYAKEITSDYDFLFAFPAKLHFQKFPLPRKPKVGVVSGHFLLNHLRRHEQCKNFVRTWIGTRTKDYVDPPCLESLSFRADLGYVLESNTAKPSS